MTLEEAVMQGYKISGTKLQRGYVSRRCDINKQIVRKAGGYRNNELYVLLPCERSTQYCYRAYLAKEEV